MAYIKTESFYDRKRFCNGGDRNQDPFSITVEINSSGSDVTDNRTSDLRSLSIPQKHLYRMDDKFHREDERLKTFDKWPLASIDKNELALSGMFYTGEEDKVKCYFCEVEIGRWEQDDQPVSEHLRWSPNCPLLRRRTTNNMPISVEALDRVLPPISYDICGANENIEVRPQAYAECAIPAPGDQSNGSQPGSSNNCTSFFPEYPEYAIEAARIRSFADWPLYMKQKPAQLAEAGFFYVGVGDRVKCFSCGGGLKDWDDTDEPWEQHGLWLSKCRFLKLMRGQTFIDSVLEKKKATAEATAAVTEEGEQEKSSEAGAVELALPKASSDASPGVDIAPQTMAIAAAAGAGADVAPMACSFERKASSSIPEDKLCKICYADEYNTAFLPCGHVVACAKCASSVTKCPLCRKPFTDVMRVYFS